MWASPAPRSAPRSMLPPTDVFTGFAELHPFAVPGRAAKQACRNRRKPIHLWRLCASGVGGSIYGRSRFDTSDPFENTYETPGWKRAQANKANRSKSSTPKAKRATTTIEGELVAKSVSDSPSKFALGERVFHLKFGYGEIKSIEGNKLTIQFQDRTKARARQFR